MKFGKQLELGTYEPWRSQYIGYGRLKRVIIRLGFLKNLREGHLTSGVGSRTHSFIDIPPETEHLTGTEGAGGIIKVPSAYIEHEPADPLDDSQHAQRIGSPARVEIDEAERSEKQALMGTNKGRETGASRLAYGNMSPKKSKNKDSAEEGSDDGTEPGSLTMDGIGAGSTDFFGLLQEEMEKVNKFFLGKLAHLRLELNTITTRLNDRQYGHHANKSGELDLCALRDTYVELAALRSFSELNKTGFYKIIKKYDKMIDELPKAMQIWMPLVHKQPFTETKEPTELMEQIAQYVSRDKLLEWENFATEEAAKQADKILPSVRLVPLSLSLAVFLVSMRTELIVPPDPCASRCLSLVVLVVSLWITEAIPYFSTALLILPLSVFMDVFKDPDDWSMPVGRDQAADKVMHSMFNHTSWLLLGGYAVSSAISRCDVELSIAAYLQRTFGHQPKVFILAIMFLGLFLSMWISNHTAPILCSTIILPVVKDLPPKSSYTKALLLGLACACNFGGMMTPIASLQNVLAVSSLEEAGIEVPFGKWIMFALPFCIICVIICWLAILALFPVDVDEIPMVVHQERHVGARRSLVLILLSGACVLMFATSSLTKDTFGDIGIISLCFLCAVFGSGLLTEVDFNSMSWHTLCLVGGGNVLGKAVANSGLLNYLTHCALKVVPMHNEWLALVSVLVFACGVGTFVSHTVASIVLMPVIVSVGVDLDMPEVIVIGAALAISGAMALPFSSFPNVNAVMLIDDLHQPFLNVSDVVRIGAPMTIVTIFLIATLGMWLIKWVLL